MWFQTLFETLEFRLSNCYEFYTRMIDFCIVIFTDNLMIYSNNLKSYRRFFSSSD